MKERELLKTSLVTVIVPVFNKDKYITRCLQSIQNQSYTNLEILVIDDGSTDKSVEKNNVNFRKRRAI
ncbi:glycosyltransferase family 2 protein [Lacticaseibacillus pantheris]|uniref:glycosyltransferase family 2 protein n=1 Tax=Lacticaseibacillus pantheris TaxID=171523 RepID=UPI0009E85D06